ncbi:MAG: hypothetical protein ACPGLV_18100, partial [Bacteroidia bacterium]
MAQAIALTFLLSIIIFSISVNSPIDPVEYKYSNSAEYLSLNNKIWFDLFNVSVDPIINHCRYILNDKKLQIKYLVLVG